MYIHIYMQYTYIYIRHNLQKYFNDFLKWIIVDWGPLNDIQDAKAMSLISSTSSMSGMFSQLLKTEHKALETPAEKIYFF